MTREVGIAVGCTGICVGMIVGVGAMVAAGVIVGVGVMVGVDVIVGGDVIVGVGVGVKNFSKQRPLTQANQLP